MIGLIAALLLIGQAEERWSDATVTPVFGDGALRGCALNFKSVKRDSLYFGGRAVGADGSFNLYHFGAGDVSAMLKVTVLDGQALRLPDTGYLITGFASNASDINSTLVSEDSGYRLISFTLGAATADAIGHVAVDSAITVGVQMNGGRSAIPFLTELSEDQAADWSECVATLLTDAEDALGATD